ncbi:MAG TPA: response regulator [Candidatus Competibacteraceae bacterium]|nr:response regulator [Candidatus Competibacteraceae bacterium]MCP5134394.1 response regulator [Gammaproteobacteria bacterium]HPF57825.1 response regulator [Candidatus Competibacteraceae bacterium]HRY17395.1 response regulator [Candidatus Competibacteraceae bacterium]
MSGSGKRILIIEDEALIRRLISLSLEEKYVLREAENGQKGLELLGSWRPHLVILDIMMPVMDGLQFLSWRNQHHPDMPVLALTSIKQPNRQGRILSAGASAVLFKPISLPELLEQVVKLLPG